MRRSSVSRMQGSTFFFFQKKKKIKNLCSALERMSENPLSKIACDEKLSWFKISSQYRALDTNAGEADWIWVEYLPGFSTFAALLQSPRVLVKKWNVEPEDFTGRIIFMSMFNDISWISQENKQGCELSAQLVSIYAKRFSPGRWSFFWPGSEKKCYSTHESKTTRRMWDRVAELMMSTTKPNIPYKIQKIRHALHRGGSRIHEVNVMDSTLKSDRGERGSIQ